ncbi:MAG: UDP-N-acetylmuramoyl-L-alanine--D-glutamate ligase [Clostridium sp.]
MSQKVLVAGTGISGIAAAKLLLSKGGEVVLYDGNDKLDEKKIKKKFEEDAKVTVLLGELRKTDLLGVELSVISPGISLEAPFVSVLDEASIPVWSEIQLAYHCAKGKLAAITGTNGKTTTTALTGEIMKAHYDSVFVVGNIGDPYTAHAMETTEESVTIAEVSSFQLETIMDFRPNVSAILNITPDHLDRHKTMERYIEIKENVTKNQKDDDTCVLNYDDAVLREFGETLKIKVVYFSSRQTLKKGYYMDDDRIVYNDGSKITEIVNVHDLKLLGRHNHENVMAAVAISMNMNVPLPTIQKVIKEFEAVEHRIEYVTERFGVKYYNDSKGTNPDAAMQAIKAMPGPTILIAGGYDKHSEFDEWIDSFDGKVRYLVLIGQTRDLIADCAKKHGFRDIMYAEDLLEAVQVCASYANAGDSVLLSPACASWGQFANYEERGRKFKEYVRAL